MRMSFSEKVRYIALMPTEKKGWLVVFTLGSLLAWAAIRVIPMRKLSQLMGHHFSNKVVCIPVETDQSRVALEMGQLMGMIANNTPWPCQCLSQALCVKWLLNYYKIPSIMHLGAKITKVDGSQMQAHAWINVGQHTIIGGPQHTHYRVVATFTTPRLS